MLVIFLYAVWNAGYQRQLTLPGMELQAEIDKFILIRSLLDDHKDNDAINKLRVWLFENNEYGSNLDANELERYEQANYYAGKYCQVLQQKYKLAGLDKTLLNDLRRLYRMSQQDKLN